jgi:hypothetical protein
MEGGNKNMKNKIVGIFVCMLMFASVLSVAAPVNKKETSISSPGSKGVEWSKTYGGSEFDELRCVQETADGGYIACGETELSNNFYSWVLKVDAAGNEEWNWTQTQFYYNGTYYDIIDAYSICIQQINDGGYLVGLQLTFVYNTEKLIFGGLAKLSAAGAEEWVQIYADEFSWSFCPCSLIVEDDGYLLVGVSGAPELTATDTAGAMLKTNTNGVEQWRQEYQYSNGYDYGFGVCRTTDNGYLITGYVQITTTKYNYWMIKTDANGNEQWNKTFSRSAGYGDYANVGNCYQTPDGGYIMGGYSYTSGLNSDLWMVKTDSSGTMDWNKTYGDSSRETMWSFEQTNDAGYVLCDTNNFTHTQGDKEDIILIKIDENGNTKWVQKFGGPGQQIGIYVNNTRDGGFIVSGRTGAYQNPTSDGLLVKFDSGYVELNVDIKGGLGVKAVITNNGTENATGVPYQIHVEGGILGIINKTKNGTIDVPAGKSVTVSTGVLLGLGSISISARVASIEKMVNGTQLFIFSMVKK